MKEIVKEFNRVMKVLKPLGYDTIWDSKLRKIRLTMMQENGFSKDIGYFCKGVWELPKELEMLVNGVEQ